MGTVIYCDRVKHEVRDHWHDVANAIRHVQSVEAGAPSDADGVTCPVGFIAVMPVSREVGASTQVLLRASAITSLYNTTPEPANVSFAIDGRALAEAVAAA